MLLSTHSAQTASARESPTQNVSGTEVKKPWHGERTVGTPVYFPLATCASYFQSLSAVWKRCCVHRCALRMGVKSQQSSTRKLCLSLSWAALGWTTCSLDVESLKAWSCLHPKLNGSSSGSFLVGKSCPIKGTMLACSDFRRLKCLTCKSIEEIINGELIRF